MKKRTSPRETGTLRPIPRLTLRPEEAAISIGVSLSMLHLLVSEGKLPKPFNPPGHSGVNLYDVDDLRSAVREWKDGAYSPNPWDDI